MVLPNLKAVLLKPFSELEEKSESGASTFVDLPLPEEVYGKPSKKKAMHGIYKVVGMNKQHTLEYEVEIGDTVLVEEAAVSEFEWEGEKYYFVNSPQYIPVILVR